MEEIRIKCSESINGEGTPNITYLIIRTDNTGTCYNSLSINNFLNKNIFTTALNEDQNNLLNAFLAGIETENKTLYNDGDLRVILSLHEGGLFLVNMASKDLNRTYQLS